jgi:hypothetical protein
VNKTKPESLKTTNILIMLTAQVSLDVMAK